MEKIADYLPRRKAEILDQISQLKTELRQIAAAEAAGAVIVRPKAGMVAHGDKATIKEQVIAILGDHPAGLEATEILERLAVRFGRHLKRESLSPQLSRLGADGVVAREGKIWILPVTKSALDRFRANFEASRAPSNGEAPPKENPQELAS